MRIALFVALAGALGSISRYAVGAAVQRVARTALPVGTFTVNVVGSFLIGAVIAVFAARGASQSAARIAITVGFLGGFTTYSAFAFETITLIESDQLARAGGYVAATLAVAGVACWLGLWVGRSLS